MDKQTTFDLFEIDINDDTENFDINFDTNEINEINKTLDIQTFDTSSFEYADFNKEFEIESIGNDGFEIEKPFEEKEKPVIDDIKFQTLDTTRFTNEIGEINVIEEIEEPIIKFNIGDETTKFIEEKNDFGKVKIVVLGVGGCGCNAIHRMYQSTNDAIELIAIDTDASSLELINADKKILIGENTLFGNGSGNDYLKVTTAFEQASEKIKNILEDVNMLFISGSLAGGTGKIGLLEISKLAKEMGILTIGFATLPRKFESNIDDVNKHYNAFVDLVDSSVIIENERVAALSKGMTIKEIAYQIDSLLTNGIKGIYELVTKPGKINLDYADIKTAFKNKGASIMAIGTGKGENNVVDAVENAIGSKLLDLDLIKSAKIIIFAITSGKNKITIEQATKGTNLIYSFADRDNVEQMFLGYAYDEALGDEVKVTLIATGIDIKEINYDYENLDENNFVFSKEIEKRNEIEEIKEEVISTSDRPDFFI